MIVAGATIFWSAFLLFVVQPLVAQILLPSFGGSPAVWIVALVFFQSVLLLGYLYAHLSARLLTGSRAAVLHATLIAGALATLPLEIEPPASRANPAIAILSLLAVSLGPPLLTLSATTPLLQYFSEGTRGLYRLFAVSNLGSLLGLWCFPFVLERWTTSGFQLRFWTWGYAGYALLALASAVSWRRAPRGAEHLPGKLGDRFLWLALSATGAALLMGTTNQLTRNVAAVPFLWVLPLSLYLLSFIVAFDHDRWYVRWLWGGVFLGSLLGVLELLSRDDEPGLYLQIAVYSVNLLAGAMLCHGELARRRPPGEGLTVFYLYVAAGGVLGGSAVSLAAPELFRGYWEYPIALGAAYLLAGLAMGLTGTRRYAWLVGGLVLAAALGSYVHSEGAYALTMKRSFFGVLRVYERFRGSPEWERDLWNGPIAHGGQLMAPEWRRTPILYYGPDTGVAMALRFTAHGPRRIGVIGLGTGSLAAYGRAGDRFYFFEINPDVAAIAREYFTYLEDTPADVEIVLGDGRVELARREGLDLDVLVVDAFVGDAIPVHLLTREAFAIYDRHLAPDGILVVHVSNLHFDLKPVVRAQAEAMGAVAVVVESEPDERKHLYTTDWVLVTRNAELLADPEFQSHWAPRVAEEGEDLAASEWTDDHPRLFDALRRR